MSISNADEGQKVKNYSSIRKIPLHPHLIKLGVPNLVKYAQEHGEKFLFWNDIKNEALGCNASTIFNNDLKRLGLEPDENEKRLCLHSFRSTLENQLRNHNVAKGHIDGYLGHAESGSGAIYADKYSVSFFLKHVIPNIDTDLRFMKDNIWIQKIITI